MGKRNRGRRGRSVNGNSQQPARLRKPSESKAVIISAPEDRKADGKGTALVTRKPVDSVRMQPLFGGSALGGAQNTVFEKLGAIAGERADIGADLIEIEQETNEALGDYRKLRMANLQRINAAVNDEAAALNNGTVKG